MYTRFVQMCIRLVQMCIRLVQMYIRLVQMYTRFVQMYIRFVQKYIRFNQSSTGPDKTCKIRFFFTKKSHNKDSLGSAILYPYIMNH